MKKIAQMLLISMLVGSLLLPMPFGLADGPVTLSINDVALPIGGSAQGIIHVANVVNLGSFGLSLGYDPTVVTPTAVQDKDLTGVNYYINTATHTITLNWYTTGSVSGDHDLAAITFEPAAQAQAGDSGALTLSGGLYDNTPAGNQITCTTQDGTASISGGTSSMKLVMDDISVPENGNANGYLRIENVDELGSLDVMVFRNDHGLPHFHVIGTEFSAKFAIADLALLSSKGRIRRRDIKAVEEWGRRHQAELYLNWELARAGGRAQKIED